MEQTNIKVDLRWNPIDEAGIAHLVIFNPKRYSYMAHNILQSKNMQFELPRDDFRLEARHEGIVMMLEEVAECYSGGAHSDYVRDHLAAALISTDSHERGAAWETVLQDGKVDEDQREFVIDFLEAEGKKKRCIVLLKERMLSVLPVVDIVLDGVQMYTYWQDKQYQFLGIIACGALFNCLASTWTAVQHGDWGVAFLNFFTVGTAGLFMEAQKSAKRGVISDLLLTYKLWESVESWLSWGVSNYALVIAGYLPGYKALEWKNQAVKWSSMSTSLVIIPKQAYDASTQEISKSRRLTIQARDSESLTCLKAFHFCDLAAMLVLFPFQLATRPYGIFIYFFSVGAVAYMFARVHHVPMVTALLQTPVMLVMLPLKEDATQAAWAHVVSEVKIMALAIAWLVLAIHMWADIRLREHIIQSACLPSSLLAAVSLIGLIYSKMILDRQGIFGGKGYTPLLDTPESQPASHRSVEPQAPANSA